jgi:hypothetical protein
MTRRGLRPLLLLAVVLAALAFCGVGQARTNCTSAVLQDWRDGRIDGTYSVDCYRTALKHLPEDLRIYSSAESDIQRALLASSHKALAAPAKAHAAPAKAQASTKSDSGGTGVSPLLVLAIGGVILAALASAFALVR